MKLRNIICKSKGSLQCGTTEIGDDVKCVTIKGICQGSITERLVVKRYQQITVNRHESVSKVWNERDTTKWEEGKNDRREQRQREKKDFWVRKILEWMVPKSPSCLQEKYKYPRSQKSTFHSYDKQDVRPEEHDNTLIYTVYSLTYMKIPMNHWLNIT